MGKKILFFVMILFISVVGAKSAKADTQVQGALTQSTTWTVANSPYVIVNTVEIPSGKTLTIEPGVIINSPDNFTMFKLIGNIVARGEEDNPIIFNGGGNSLFFNLLNSKTITSAELEYCQFSDGTALWNYGPGYFNLRHSLIENLSKSSYIWYPNSDIYIEYNRFINAAGFAIDQSGDNHVYIRYNLFNGLNPALSKFDDFFVQSKSSYDNSEIVLEYNSFINIDGIALELESGADRAKMSAANNYWGTDNKEIIDRMIYDKNDDARAAGNIEYEPILLEPDPDTPDISRPDTPTLDPVVSLTNIPSQIISGTKEKNTGIILNNEEIVPISSSTLWSYNLELVLGENLLNLKAVDEAGVESLPATATILYELPKEIICDNWAYSEWGECQEGRQTRTIISAEPENCSGGEPVLSRACAGMADNNFVETEKKLVVSVDNNLAKRLSGRILLQVEENGEGWYIYPDNFKKYYLGRPADAFAIMRELGLGATHEFISGHDIFPEYVLGKILLDVELNGEAYYINPVDKKAYYLGRPADAFAIMRNLGLGITNEDVRKIEVGETE